MFNQISKEWLAFAGIAPADIPQVPEPALPALPLRFRALALNPADVRVVVLGQDPYPTKGDAMGLSFSVDRSTNLPPSLRNIFKELHSDMGITRTNGNLQDWADQGVLLLNTVLTVREGKAKSHADLGWEAVTDKLIQALAYRKTELVFVLWGSPAHKKESLIPSDKGHLILKSVHPSPLAAYRGFFGSEPFSKTNEFLEKTGTRKIEW